MILHSKPTIDNRDIEEVKKVLKSGMIAQSKKVEEFEKNFSSYLKVKDSVVTSSGTSALHLSLIALNVKENDEVIIPAYCCSAILNSILYIRANPVLVDVNLDDFNISFKDVRKKLNKKTKAIILPHLFGQPADLQEIKNIDVPVIEDIAQSLGANYNNKKVGSFGTLSVCSFYATKVITCGEGGIDFFILYFTFSNTWGKIK